MKRLSGLTLIELVIVIAILGILLSIAIPAVTGTRSGTPADLTWGFNGVTESRCIDGYRFVVGQDGGARQIMDEMGRGVKCQ